MITGGELLLVLNILIVPVALLVRRAREFGAGFLLIAGHFWSLTLVLWCAVEVFQRWGLFWTALGLLAGGVGVVPIAFFGFLFSRAWSASFELYLQCLLVIVAYGLSQWMMRTTLD